MDERERAWISVGRESPGGAENPKGKKKGLAEAKPLNLVVATPAFEKDSYRADIKYISYFCFFK